MINNDGILSVARTFNWCCPARLSQQRFHRDLDPSALRHPFVYNGLTYLLCV